MKYLFDSSALLAYYLQEAPAATTIKRLLDDVIARKADGVVSVVTLTEIISLLGKRGHEVVMHLENSALEIRDIDGAIAKLGGHLRTKYKALGVSTADCLIIATAIECEADRVVSLDRVWKAITEIQLE